MYNHIRNWPHKAFLNFTKRLLLVQYGNRDSMALMEAKAWAWKHWAIPIGVLCDGIILYTASSHVFVKKASPQWANSCSQYNWLSPIFFFSSSKFCYSNFLAPFFEDLPLLERWIGEKSLGRTDVFGNNSKMLEV